MTDCTISGNYWWYLNILVSSGIMTWQMMSLWCNVNHYHVSTLCQMHCSSQAGKMLVFDFIMFPICSSWLLVSMPSLSIRNVTGYGVEYDIFGVLSSYSVISRKAVQGILWIEYQARPHYSQQFVLIYHWDRHEKENIVYHHLSSKINTWQQGGITYSAIKREASAPQMSPE